MAADLSQRSGWLPAQDVERIKTLLVAAGLPITTPQGMTVEQFMTLMAVDKKVQNGVIRLVLLQGIGKAVISDDYSPDMLTKTLESFQH